MPRNLFQHPPYVNFARSLQDQLNAVEHYIVDTRGTTLFLDADGNPSWFIVKDEVDMKSLENLARDQEAPAHLIRGIEDRLLIPFFLSDEDYEQPVSEW